jgi:hypothetical protein
LEIEGSATGLLEMAGQATAAPDVTRADPEQSQRDHSTKKDGVIDLTNHDGVWVEDALQGKGKPASDGKTTPVEAARQLIYDWRGKPVNLRKTFAGSLLSVYA